MSDLQNLTPANTYKGLLQVGDYTNGVDSTVKAVLDGEGTASALAIGTTKVGIGTTSPTQELDVNGDIVSTTLTTSGAVTAGSVSTSGAVTGGSLDVSGNVVADEYALDQTGTSSSAVAIHAPATNELAIRTNSTEAMRIDSLGSVGLGTASPDGPLHVYNTAANQLNLTRAINVIGSSSGASAEIHGGALAGTSPSTAGVIGFTLKDSDGAGSGVNTEGDIFFQTKNSGSDLSTKMVIDSNGNCGIGTEDPSAKLEVYGDFPKLNLVRSTVGGGVDGIELKSSGNGSTINERSGIITLDTPLSGTEEATLIIGTKNGSTDNHTLYLKDNNVGIGTESPTKPLEVASTTGGVIVPRMNTTQRTAISSPAPGEMVYDTDLNKFYGYTSSEWTALH